MVGERIMKSRKICVVTGSRAEYGLLYQLMKNMDSDPDLKLQLIATGMHLSPEFGLTYKVIEEDGFTIHRKVEMLLSSDTPVGITKSIGLGVIGFADAFEALKPDIVVLLGDRYEIFAAAQAAMIARIPIAHLHGGERTEGALDESIRHAITKMSHYHFVSAEIYLKRVIQLGENPGRVFNVGAVGIDNIKKTKLLSKSELEESLNFKFGQLNFLITYHPVTLSEENSEVLMRELLTALDAYPDAKIIFTKPNADTDGRMIGKMIDKFAQSNKERIHVSTSLGQLRYLSTIQHVDVVIGNSSSGIIEVPYFYKPTVNIGPRQKGRLSGISVINCNENSCDIVNAINKALSTEFNKNIQGMNMLFGNGDAALKIKETLKAVDISDVVKKEFYDIKCKFEEKLR